MKIPGNTQHPTTFPGNISLKIVDPLPDSDLQVRKNSQKHARQKPRTPVSRLKKNRASVGRRSRPETPLLKWKIHERERNDDPLEEDARSVPECGKRSGRKGKMRREETVSVRKLAAGIWRMQLPEVDIAGEERRGLQRSENQLELQHGIGHGGILPFLCHRYGKGYGSDPKDLPQSPTVSRAKNGLFCKLDPSFQYPNTAMEGKTKWDPVCPISSDETQQIRGHMKLPDQQISAVSVVSALEAELDQARARIQELETERRSSKKKIEHFLRKVSEERASWRSREHEKIRVYIDDIKAELSRERKNRQRIEIVNSRLVNELADAKVSAKHYMQDYEKERKGRELIEEVCDELAKEIGEDKAEAEALKRESMRLREEVEDERKMLQMAEVWREERVQMKLVDAKVALEEKYSQMIKLVADLESFLKSRNTISDVKDMKEAELLRQASASLNIQDIKGFSYEPPQSR
ncbi:Actin cytoskeleton-regulatory complex pan-like protein [Quillaja saponaria]|uniref:Actin cytoskeleton-regulatory complex pan-like protein n=1 Tax=Quillaja saponaria TaxID=32244 RepID=A0AAD7LTI8_QUISA|nr:Actin cytoskeleton-regulatory complex pan-like protein [Quillaja saponaria]